MDKEKKAIERLILAADMSKQYYEKPLIIAYSGGKDSEVLVELAKRSGIDFIVSHNHTTADAPQTVYHIRNVFADLEKKGYKCKINYPEMTMWELIVKKTIPPTRLIRYCCEKLKENNGKECMVATGVRWGESYKRKTTRGIYEDVNRNKEKKIVLLNDNDDKRRLFERCEIKANTIINPIIDFTDDEIWDYYDNECKYRNPLYDIGFNRVGCIGCAMAGRKGRLREFELFPKYKELYLRAFDRMLKHREARGLDNRNWHTAEDVFEWWVSK